MTFSCCTCIPHRYFVVLMCFIGMLISVGYRTSFALVITHINVVNFSSATSADDNSLFPNCTTEGTHRDYLTHWKGSTSLLFNTFYFVGQLITSIPGGALVQKFSAKRIYGATIFISSVLQLLLPLVISNNLPDWFIYIFRFVQGATEAITVPSLNSVISAWAPKHQRARLINYAYAGVYLSPALANFSTGACLCYVSWSSILYIYGAAGVIWTIFFFLFVYSSPQQHPCLCEMERSLMQVQTAAPSVSTADKTPWGRFFTSMPVWAMFVAAFSRNFGFAMLITEVQQYYKDVYRLSAAMNGLLNGLPHIFMVIFMIIGANIFDYLGKRELLSITNVRKIAQSLGFGVTGIAFLVIGFTDNHIQAFILFCVGVAFSGFSISGYQTNPLDLAPRYVGPLTGISRTGMAGSILSTVLAAETAGDSHSLKDWQNLFIVGGSLYLAGVVFYAIFASGEKQPWAEPEYTAIINEPNDIETSKSSSGQFPQLSCKYGAVDKEIY